MPDDPDNSSNVSSTDVRFYGRRRGRPLRRSMRRLLDEKLPQYTFDPERPIADQFGSLAECYLEIGFGGGEHLAGLASVHSDHNFIGAEPFINGVASMLRHIENGSLSNVLIWPDDVRQILPILPDGAFSGVFIMFPDPWPKRRHAGRRILQPGVLIELARIIRLGGRLVLASDDATAKSWLLQASVSYPAFEWTARHPNDWRQRPQDLPETRYMKKAHQAGRKPSWFILNRVNVSVD
jgi:tRNA (guanine-N7-)-methyltransferase